MKLVLLGLPGSGKGTQADLVKKKYNLYHISTGNLLREAINNQTALGKEAQTYVQSGELVPDTLIINLVREVIAKRGFILDGFPRNLTQAEKLDTMLKELGIKLDIALEIKVDEDILIKRLTGRRTCSKCGALYNIYFNPPKTADVCNLCGGQLTQRNDDRAEVVNNRIKVYWSNISPVLEYYQKNKILKVIDGQQDAGKVFADISLAIEAL
ncbi:MAG: adenylate kinase [bacterium]